MGRVRQYTAALIAACLAVVFAVVGVLTLTVFRPTSEVVAETTPNRPYIMTRDGVLPLKGSAVTIQATAAPGQTVSLVVGTSGDVLGWIGDSPYTEIVGIESGMETLKTVDHPSSASQASQTQAQSGDTAGSTPQPQSGDQAQSGEADALAGDIPRGNDMWLQDVSGTGSTSLTLTKVSGGRSILAATDGLGPGPTITLRWEVQRTNTVAMVSLLLAGVFIAATAGLYLSQSRLLRHREERAERVTARMSADVTQTEQIPVTDSAVDEAAAGAAGGDQGVGAHGGPEILEAPSSVDEAKRLSLARRLEVSARAASLPDDANEGDDPTPDPDQDSLPGWDQIVSPEEAGRHGIPSTSDEDPPVIPPSDTGVIDMSGVRPGAAFPTRRALREARVRGEDSVVIEGREFDTGLMTPITDEASKDGGSWTSLMSGWISRSGKGGDSDEKSD